MEHSSDSTRNLELLSELVPHAGVIAMFVNDSSGTSQSQGAQEAARAKGLQLHILNAANESEIDAAFSTLVELHAAAVIVRPHSF